MVACRQLGYSRVAEIIRKLVLVISFYLCVYVCFLIAT